MCSREFSELYCKLWFTRSLWDVTVHDCYQSYPVMLRKWRQNHAEILSQARALQEEARCEHSHLEVRDAPHDQPAAAKTLIKLAPVGDQNVWNVFKELRNIKLQYVIPGTSISLLQTILDFNRADAHGTLFDLLGAAAVAAADGNHSAVGPGFGNAVWKLAIRIVVLQLVDWVGHILSGYFFAAAHWDMVLPAREQYLRSMLVQEAAWHEDHRSRELLSRLVSEPEALHDVVNYSLERLLRNGFALVFGLYSMISVDPWLALATLVARLPLTLQLNGYAWRNVDSYSRVQADAMSRANAAASEAITHVRTVQAHGAEELEVREYSRHIKRYIHVIRVTLLSETFFRYALLALVYLLDMTMLGVAVHRILAGTMTVGGYWAFKSYQGSCVSGWDGLVGLYHKLRSAGRQCERYFALRDRVPAIQPHAGPDGGCCGPADVESLSATPATGSISFVDVHFRYPMLRHGAIEGPAATGLGLQAAGHPTGSAADRIANPWVLRGISFHVNPGQTVALVGPSGCGKSTILRLCERFYDADRGLIEINGHDVKQQCARALRTSIGLVEQEPMLFDRSLRDNILYGLDPLSPQHPTEQQLMRVLQAAHLTDVIASLPRGLDTMVGERGCRLSGGQKQRVAIARALIRGPRILLLDEATSALDSENEHAVSAAIAGLMCGRTLLVIAHRLSTIMNADLILVIKDGLVLEAGSHHNLMQHGAFYPAYFRHQIVEQQQHASGGFCNGSGQSIGQVRVQQCN